MVYDGDDQRGIKNFCDDLYQLISENWSSLPKGVSKFKLINHPQGGSLWVNYNKMDDCTIRVSQLVSTQTSKTSKYPIIDWKQLYKQLKQKEQ